MTNMETFEEKIKILNNKPKLKEVRKNKVYFINDLTRKERKIPSITKRSTGNLIKTG